MKNVFRTYTLGCLRRSPARTLVTIIGIVLSMSLFTAVIEGGYSGLEYVRRMEAEDSGAFHGFFYRLSQQDAAAIQEDSALSDTVQWQDAGWALVEPESRLHPYLYFADISEDFTDLVSITLTEGRLPEREGEIAIPQTLVLGAQEEELEIPSLSVGDTITLRVGHRASEDGQLRQEGDPYDPDQLPEIILESVEKTFTVTGIYEEMSYAVDSLYLPAYIALTRGGGTGDVRLYFTMNHPSQFDRFEQQMKDRGYRVTGHVSLLRFYGVFGNELTRLLYGFGGILVFLVAFGSIALIYNSFSISVRERIRQFGLLRSVGATRKQIRNSVLWEALYLSVVGIPIGLVVGCAGIGVTLWALRGTFARMLNRTLSQIQIGLVLSPLPLLAASGFCLLTILFSAWLPARRALKLPILETLWQTQNVPIRRADVRGTSLSQRLFGFDGMMAARNFRRNRKRNRATVFSLFLSITLFVSASALCGYVTDSISIIEQDSSKEDLIMQQSYDPSADPDATLALLSGAEDVTDGLYFMVLVSQFYLPGDQLTSEYREALETRYNYPLEPGDALQVYSSHLCFLQDEVFRALCRKSGADEEVFFQPDQPAALLYNHIGDELRNSDGTRIRGNWPLLNPQSLPLQVWTQSEKEIDGYVRFRESTDGETRTVWYYPEEYVASFQGPSEEMDPDLAIVLEGEDAYEKHYYKVAALTDEVPFSFGTNTPVLFYPYSQRTAVMGENLKYTSINYAFQSRNESRSYLSMAELLKQDGMSMNDLYISNGTRNIRMVVVVARVFSLGFIILISLIAAANVFNTISTGVALRRRELGILRSIGLGPKGFRKMMSLECLLYGAWGIVLGLPASFLMCRLIYLVTAGVLIIRFRIPWGSVVLSILGVFLVVFASMLYSVRCMEKEDLVSSIRSETF